MKLPFEYLPKSARKVKDFQNSRFLAHELAGRELFGTIIGKGCPDTYYLMRNLRIYLITGIFPLFMMSCASSRVPFTQQLRDQNKLNMEELKSIQFYTSNTLVLKRGENQDIKETEKGELTVVKDAKVEEVIIRAGTPCVIKEVVDGNRITVSFNQDGSKYLVFGSVSNRDGYYTLMARDWKNGKGKVNYGEQTFMTSPGSKDVFLVFKMKTMQQFKLDRKVEKGAEVR